ncbi:anthranilate synthase component I family protein [Marinicrinis lubricantis]|uniref:Anthranilate synthase component I family protein n=1 Tax=Marinicrinis lubricantis TaxID=2086470 RepID=A0ABW1IPY5_9BACL
MNFTSLSQWKGWAADYPYIPLIESFPLEEELAVETWLPAWQSFSQFGYVLESGKGGRYTYLGGHIQESLRCKDGQAEWLSGNGAIRKEEGEPLALLRQWMLQRQGPSIPELPFFTGGFVGYFSYDFVRWLEELPNTAADDLQCPDVYFMHSTELWIWDHHDHQLYCVCYVPAPEQGADEKQWKNAYENAQQRVRSMYEWFKEKLVTQSGEGTAAFHKQSLQQYESDLADETLWETAFSKEQYMEAVKSIQRYIGQGDVFQVNLSLRRSRAYDGHPEELYEALRRVNPSPYMGFLKFPEMSIVSASPELLVKLQGRRISTRPIAGTRRRGRSPEEEQQFIDELKSSEKEIAEHVMLVDLERNDLGRVSKFGSVKVDEFMVMEYYSHVMHLVSEISGTLAEGLDALDVIRAVFPGGTITGAPKVRTMEIIEELEPVRRGTYTGSMGWIDYSGNMEFNIIIRTLTVKDGKVHLQAGAGIVIDSDPEREYKESLNKAKAMAKALQYDHLERKARRL